MSDLGFDRELVDQSTAPREPEPERAGGAEAPPENALHVLDPGAFVEELGADPDAISLADRFDHRLPSPCMDPHVARQLRGGGGHRRGREGVELAVLRQETNIAAHDRDVVLAVDLRLMAREDFVPHDAQATPSASSPASTSRAVWTPSIA